MVVDWLDIIGDQPIRQIILSHGYLYQVQHILINSKQLQQERIIDRTADTSKYTKEAKKDMGTPLTTYYKSQVKEKYGEEVFYNDSVFFLPVINRIFELTKI